LVYFFVFIIKNARSKKQKSTLHVSDRSTVHHQEYLDTVDMQQVFVMLVLLLSASRQPTEPALQIPIAAYTVLRYSWWWTVDLSETCSVLYQI